MGRADKTRYRHGNRVLRDPEPLLAHEIVRGDLAVQAAAHGGRPPPTAVLVHGILGNRRNLGGFARRLLAEHPGWQVVLVDLRCHGESAGLGGSLRGPHTVRAAAGDVLRLLTSLKLFPELLVGHSFGGKVVMAVAEQWAVRHTAALPRPVQVWALDSLPGPIVAQYGGGAGGAYGRENSSTTATAAISPPARRALGADHPADLIAALRRIPTPVAGRGEVVTALRGQGFSQAVATWAATGLRPLRASDAGGPLVWGPDLAGIAAMYSDYEAADLWPWASARLQGVSLNLVRAERSAFEWSTRTMARLAAVEARVYDLPAAGHWVHSDNPEGLARILAPALLEATPSWLRPHDEAGNGLAQQPGQSFVASHHVAAPIPGPVPSRHTPVDTELFAPLGERSPRPGAPFGDVMVAGIPSRHAASPTRLVH